MRYFYIFLGAVFLGFIFFFFLENREEQYNIEDVAISDYEIKEGEGVGDVVRSPLSGASDTNTEELQMDVEGKDERISENDKNSEKESEDSSLNIPDKMKIDVPFTSQAPYAIWDEKHEEACEEASLIMMKYYLKNENLTKEKAENEIQAMIDFQIQEYGDFRDSNAQQMMEIAEKFLGMNNLRVVYDFSKEDIKKELAKGNPVIVPAAGRVLNNPFYTPPGPLYHAIVLTGYDGDNIITNDPGTKRGKNFNYNISVVYEAAHDFPGSKENILNGRKAMIVVEVAF